MPSKLTIDTNALNVPWQPNKSYRIELAADFVREATNNKSPNPANANLITFTTLADGGTIGTYNIGNGQQNISYDTVTSFRMNANRGINSETGVAKLYKKIYVENIADELIYEFLPTDTARVAFNTEPGISNGSVVLNTLGLLEAEQTYYFVLETPSYISFDKFPTENTDGKIRNIKAVTVNGVASANKLITVYDSDPRINEQSVEFQSTVSTPAYLFVSSDSDFDYGSSNFNIKFFIRLKSQNSNIVIFDQRPTATPSGAHPVLMLSNGVLQYRTAGAVRITGPNLSINTWHHVHLSRNGNSTVLYVQGVRVGSVYTDNNVYVAGPLHIGNQNPAIPLITPGPRSAKTVTAVGNTKNSTAQNKFGTASVQLDGVGDFLTHTAGSDLNFSNNQDFTVECFVRFTSTAGSQVIFSGPRQTDSINLTAVNVGNGHQFRLSRINTATDIFSSVVTVNANEWYHIAIARSGNTTAIYFNGINIGQSTTVQNRFFSPNLNIGAIDLTDGGYLYGFIDEFRISNTARYTANFTPSTQAFTDDVNTLLLLHCNGANNTTSFPDDNSSTIAPSFYLSHLTIEKLDTTNTQPNPGSAGNVPINVVPNRYTVLLLHGLKDFVSQIFFDTARRTAKTITVGGNAQIANPTTWTQISTGTNHTLAINTIGELYAWGLNTSGQLGVGDTSNRLVPTRVGSDSNWSKVSAGTNHSFAIKSTGQMYGWGSHATGQLGIGQGSFYTETLWTTPQEIPLGTDNNFVDVSAGNSYTLAIRNNGTLWGTGLNSSFQLGRGTNALTGQPDKLTRFVFEQIGSLNHWKQVKASQLHSMAINTSGQMYGWGVNSQGALGFGSVYLNVSVREPTTNISLWTSYRFSQISLGPYNGMGVTLSNNNTASGELYAWGQNTNGSLGLGDTSNRLVPTRVGSDSDWSKVFVSSDYALAIKTSGELYAWGSNSSGQLGLGDTSNRLVPTRVGSDSNWAQVGGGVTGGYSFVANSATVHTLAVNTSGQMYAWGLNNFGQLGLGDTTQRIIPSRFTSNDIAKFGTGSIVFDGTSFLEINSSQFVFGNNKDFTVECFVNFSNISSDRTIFTLYDQTNSLVIFKLYLSNNNLSYFSPSVGSVTTTAIPSGIGTWRHYAVSRSGSITKIFLDGVQVASFSTTINFNTNRLYIGTYSILNQSPLSLGDPLIGQVDEICVSQSAKYTANFTPPTAEFRNNQETLLLVHANGANNSTTITDDVIPPLDTLRQNIADQVKNAGNNYGQNMSYLGNDALGNPVFCTGFIKTNNEAKLIILRVNLTNRSISKSVEYTVDPGNSALYISVSSERDGAGLRTVSGFENFGYVVWSRLDNTSVRAAAFSYDLNNLTLTLGTSIQIYSSRNQAAGHYIGNRRVAVVSNGGSNGNYLIQNFATRTAGSTTLTKSVLSDIETLGGFGQGGGYHTRGSNSDAWVNVLSSGNNGHGWHFNQMKYNGGAMVGADLNPESGVLNTLCKLTQMNNSNKFLTACAGDFPDIANNLIRATLVTVNFTNQTFQTSNFLTLNTINTQYSLVEGTQDDEAFFVIVDITDGNKLKYKKITLLNNGLYQSNFRTLTIGNTQNYAYMDAARVVQCGNDHVMIIGMRNNVSGSMDVAVVVNP